MYSDSRLSIGLDTIRTIVIKTKQGELSDCSVVIEDFELISH